MRPEEIFDHIDIYGKAAHQTSLVDTCPICLRLYPLHIVAKRCLSCYSFHGTTHGSLRFTGALYASPKGAKSWVQSDQFSWTGPDIQVDVSSDWLRRSFDFIYHHVPRDPYIFVVKTQAKRSLEYADLQVNHDNDLIIISGPSSAVIKAARDNRTILRSNVRAVQQQNSWDTATREGRFLEIMLGNRKVWTI